MNILILSTSHPYKTAGVIANDLCNTLNQQGHTAKLMVKVYDNYHNEYILNYHPKTEYYIYDICRRIRNKIRRTFKLIRDNKDYCIQTLNQTKRLVSTKRILKKIKFKPDAILIYFTQMFLNFIDIYNLFIKTEAPIFFIVPDMAIFTGLCHYSWNCTNYQNECGNCPAIYSTNQNDISKYNLKAKLEFASKMDMVALCVSEWIIKKIKSSALFKNQKCFKIPSSTTRMDFFPAGNQQKKALRRKYGINEDSFVISFGSINLRHKRKGIHHIVRALNKIPRELLKEKKVKVIIAGSGLLPEELLIDDVKFFGFLNWQELVEFYQISDLYISASIQDVGPATIIEAMLCGVPVVSYNTGIAKDWVINDNTGYLVKNEDINELYNGIVKFLKKSKSERKNIHRNCIEYSKKNNNPSKFYKSIEKIISAHINN